MHGRSPSYRVSGRFIWESLVAEAERTGALDSAALVRAASKIWLILDRFTQAMATAYRDVVTERIIAHEHERSALVAALLDGRITDHQTLWESAEALGISHRGPYVVVAAELTRVGRQALPDGPAPAAAHHRGHRPQLHRAAGRRRTLPRPGSRPAAAGLTHGVREAPAKMPVRYPSYPSGR